MHQFAVQHIPGTVDACPLDGRMHIRLRAARGQVAAAALIWQCDKNLWHLSRQEAPMERTFSDSQLDYFSLSVRLTDTRFAYIFRLSCADGKTRYLSEEGLSLGYDHSLGYFSFFQYTSQFPCDMMKVPSWVPSAVCYQIFPERFCMGDPSKDTSYINTAWGGKPTPKSYCGGDLDGIREKLPYLLDLGINTLYLTPVFTSPTNHKYEIVDYEHVDPAFGGNEALRKLVSAAHAAGVRVILDGVFNHCSSRHPFFLDAQKRGKASPYYDWFFFEEDGAYRTFGSVRTMPKLNTGNPEVIAYFADLAVRWMRSCRVDGWRLDVSDEISHRFLRHFREAVTAEDPDVLIIGEDWHRAARSLNGDEYDGLMNYALTKALLDLFSFDAIDAAAFSDRLVRLYHSYSIAAAPKMLNLLGSHDTHRFLTRVKGDKQKLRTALAVLFFFPGIPCVYYGDEIGMTGGYDPDCRRCFPWKEEAWDQETRALVRSLARLKRQSALSQGKFNVAEQDGEIILTRVAPDQTAVLRVNGTARARYGLAPFGFDMTIC